MAPDRRNDESTIALIILVNGLVAAGVVLIVGNAKDRLPLAIPLAIIIAGAAVGGSRLWYRIRDRWRASRRSS